MLWVCLMLTPRVPLRVPCMSEMLTACTAHPEQLRLPRGVYRPSWPLASCWFRRCLMSELVLRLEKGKEALAPPSPARPFCFSGSPRSWLSQAPLHQALTPPAFSFPVELAPVPQGWAHFLLLVREQLKHRDQGSWS